jgi:hypothetical protein
MRKVISTPHPWSRAKPPCGTVQPRGGASLGTMGRSGKGTYRLALTGH